MSHHSLRSLLWAGAASLVFVGSIGLGAQNPADFTNNIKFDRGQDIQPVYGHLKADWEITPDGGSAGTRTTVEARTNKAPTLAVQAATSIKAGAPLTLSATVSDDGLPKQRPPAKAAVGQETPPTLKGTLKGSDVVNVPWLDERPRRRPTGLTVNWYVLRGPADGSFDPADAVVKDGKTVTTAKFTVPGEYILRAEAQDSYLTTGRDVKLTVTP